MDESRNLWKQEPDTTSPNPTALPIAEVRAFMLVRLLSVTASAMTATLKRLRVGVI